MSRLRNAFRRQDSSLGGAVAAAPTLDHSTSPSPSLNDGKDGEELELADAKTGTVDPPPYQHHADEHRPADPSALELDELDPENKLANGRERPIESAQDVASRLVSTEDDESTTVHTVRMYFLGLGMTTFAAVLGQIFYFRPSGLSVSGLFILVITHVLGSLLHLLLPNAERGRVWAVLNPGPMSIKETTAVVIMATTSFTSASAVGVFAVDELYYDLGVNYGLAIFTLIGSQFAGYGIAGLMRAVVVYPSYAVWPAQLPVVQLLQLLHTDRDVVQQRRRLKLFLIVAAALFVWEWFPEFIAPTLTGVSIFCLAKRDGVWWSRIFAGAYPNTGLGLFSVCLDWVYLSGSGSLYTPLSTQLTLYAGVAISAILIASTYAANIWNAQSFPFMAQDLFLANGSVYDQTLILNADYTLNRTLLEDYGLPSYSTSFALYYLGTNLALGATITHCALWYWTDAKKAFSSWRTRSVADPHYQKMLRYKEVPMWVYGAVLLASLAMAFATCYTGDSHLPWYGVIVAFIVSIVLFPFLAAFAAITGWQVDSSVLVQMLGSAVVPGNPQANMYFSLYGSTTSTQGISLASDLKLAQYVKLPPRTTLWVQSLGTVVGGILQIVIAKQILASQREILLDVAGTNIWSGANVQAVNSAAVTWGALAKDMYAPGTTYEMIPLSIVVGLGVPVIPWLIHRRWPKLHMDMVITPLLCYTLGYLASGINSGNFVAFLLAVWSQWYMRKYRATWYRKYNFILSAALDASAQFFVFITTFALFGAGNGNSVVMPNWALNPADTNIDYCMVT